MAPLYFLVYCVFTSALVSGQSIRFGLVGLEVNLKPNISGQPDQILWIHNVYKVVESDGKKQQVYRSYADRVTLNWTSAELCIRDLRYEDSGEYKLEVFMNKNLLYSQFTVEVIDKVSKPTISCQMNDGSSSDTPELQATLMCSADSRRPQSLMTFEWISNGNVQPGPKLTIPLRDKQDDEVYSCRVSNPLTQETANFIAKDCYHDESSNVALVASLGALVILFIVLVVLGILFCKRQHEACFAKREDGRTDLSDEMRPLFHRAPTCPSPQQLTQDERPLERKVEDLTQFYESLKDHVVSVKKLVEKFEPTNAECTSPPDTPTDGRTDLSHEMRPLFHRAPTCPSPQQLTQDKRPLEGKVKDRKQFYESLKDHVVSVKKVMEMFEPTNAECNLPPDTSAESVKADEDKESPPAPGTSAPTAPLLSSLTQNSPNMESDAAGKPKEDTDSDQVTGEPAEESDRESDSSHLEKINGPHDSSEEKQSSTVPEEKGSEITVHEQDSNLPQHETHTQEGEHQEMNKQVSGVRNESENDPEDVNKELTSSQLPQIPTEPENHNTDTAHTHPDKEKGDKTRHESDASEEQSDNSTAEANRGEGESEAAENDNQCDQNKEQEVYSESKAVKTT